MARALPGRADEHLRPAQAGPRPRRGRPRLGRRRPASTSTSSAASPSTRSVTPTPRWSPPSPSSSTTLGHVSNFFTSPPQVELAERLLGAARRRDGRVFFTNSGTEANEAAFKLTRRTGRTHLVAAEGSFHGRTMGALALTSKQAYREPFEPLPGDVTFVPYGDEAALARAVTDETAAVVLEPIQGEAGVVVPPAGLPGRRPRDHPRQRRPALARRGADRHRPHRRLVRRRRRRPRRRHRRQGPRRRHPDRRLHRPRRGRRPCSSPATTAPPSAATRSPAPPRWPSSTPSRRRGCSTTPPTVGERLRAGLAADDAGHRGPRPRAARRARPVRARCPPRWPLRPWPRASSSTTRRPTVSASLRPWSSATMTSTRSWPPGQGSSTTPTEAHSDTLGPAPSSPTTTSAPPSRPRCWTSPPS